MLTLSRPNAKTALLTLIGLASTGAAPHYASELMHLGSSIPTVYAVLAGTIVGGSAGFTHLLRGI